MNLNTFTLGIEEEYQIVDPATRELKSHVNTELLASGRQLLSEQIKSEMHESVIEVGTKKCANIKEAKDEVYKLRSTLARLAAENGLRIIAASTHPLSDWKTQEITEQPHYLSIVEKMQDLARANLIFGLHVHVGMPDNETTIAIMNQIRYFLPHILALTTSSPFWVGRNTGLKSYRTKVFQRFPRTDLPPSFPSYSAYEDYIDLLIKTNTIDNPKKVWWDARPHPVFGTLEVRVCDLPTRVQETIAIAAVIQALAVTLYRLYKKNMSWRIYSNALISENKWRASRYGIAGQLIDFGKGEEVDLKDLVYELLNFIDEATEELDTRKEVNYIYKILEEGTSADRQLKVYQESNKDIKAVVDFLIKDTITNLDVKYK